MPDPSTPGRSSIDLDQVRHISHLSRLKLTDEEVAAFGQQLNRILEYVETLSTVNTDDVEPTAHALPVQNVFRDDAPRPSIGPDAALQNAPAAEAGYFKVPKVLDQESA